MNSIFWELTKIRILENYFMKTGKFKKRLSTHLIEYSWLYILTTLAFLIRIYFLKFRVLFSDNDSLAYLRSAKKIIFSYSEFLKTIPVYSGPIYPLFIRIFHEITQIDLTHSARLVSVIFGSLILVPFYLFLKKSYKKETAIIGSILIIFFPYLIVISLNALTESTFVFFFFLSLFYIYSAIKIENKVRYFLGGLFLSISYLVRPEAFLYFMVFWLWLIIYGKLKKIKFQKVIIFGALFTLGFSLLTIPYICLVHQRLDQWTISGKTKSIFMQHGVDKSDSLVYEKNFYELSKNSDHLSVELPESDYKGTLKSFLIDIRGEMKIFSNNLYYTYQRALLRIFSTVWFIFIGFGVLLKLRKYIDSKNFDSIFTEVFLITIIISYIAIVCLHNTALRHFAATVPLLIFLTANGIDQSVEFLLGSMKKKSRILKILIFVLLFMFVTSEAQKIRRLRHPGSNTGASEHADSFLFREAGDWIKNNLPSNPIIMSRKPFLSYYAEGTFVVLPFASFDKVLTYARKYNAKYLDINTKHIKLRPQLKFLLEEDKFSEVLELLKTFRYGSEELRLFRFKNR